MPRTNRTQRGGQAGWEISRPPNDPLPAHFRRAPEQTQEAFSDHNQRGATVVYAAIGRPLVQGFERPLRNLIINPAIEIDDLVTPTLPLISGPAAAGYRRLARQRTWAGDPTEIDALRAIQEQPEAKKSSLVNPLLIPSSHIQLQFREQESPSAHRDRRSFKLDAVLKDPSAVDGNDRYQTERNLVATIMRGGLDNGGSEQKNLPAPVIELAHGTADSALDLEDYQKKLNERFGNRTKGVVELGGVDYLHPSAYANVSPVLTIVR